MFDYQIKRTNVTVPGSFGRYSMNSIGVLVDNFEQTSVQMAEKDGVMGYEINLPYSTNGFINAALLVAVTRKGIHLPFEYLKQCRILFSDGNENNVNPRNLIWKFPEEGLEVPTYPGFFFIPGFTRYAINRNGVLISLLEGTAKLFRVGNHGYLDLGIRRDDGVYKGSNLHRLLCLTFVSYDDSINGKVVNHKDGDRSNNSIDNLEWVTERDNALHGKGLAKGYSGSAADVIKLLNEKESQDKPKLLVMNILTKEVSSFSSQKAAADFMGVSAATVVIKLNNNAVYPVIKDLYIIKREGSDWPVWDNTIEYIQAKDKTTLAKNVSTGEILSFRSAKEAYTVLKLSKKKVTMSLRRRDRRNIDGFVFKYESDDKPF